MFRSVAICDSPYNNEHTVDSLVDQFGKMTFGNYTTFCMLCAQARPKGLKQHEFQFSNFEERLRIVSNHSKYI